jgi:hypothetical protein
MEFIVLTVVLLCRMFGFRYLLNIANRSSINARKNYLSLQVCETSRILGLILGLMKDYFTSDGDRAS